MLRHLLPLRGSPPIQGNRESFGYPQVAVHTRGLGAAFEKSQHICIVGPPGSGKTTLARKLSVLLKRPAIQMDDLAYEFSLRMGRSPKNEEWPEIIDSALSDMPVITEGFYASSVKQRFQSADIILYYNLPRWHCLSSAFIRGLKNIVTSTTAHPETRESFSSRIVYTFSPYLYWRIIRFYSLYQTWLLQYFEQFKHEKIIIEIGSRALSDSFVASLGKEIAVLPTPIQHRTEQNPY